MPILVSGSRHDLSIGRRDVVELPQGGSRISGFFTDLKSRLLAFLNLRRLREILFSKSFGLYRASGVCFPSFCSCLQQNEQHWFALKHHCGQHTANFLYLSPFPEINHMKQLLHLLDVVDIYFVSQSIYFDLQAIQGFPELPLITSSNFGI